MDAIEAIHGRRSVRSFRPDPLKRDLIESLILDAAQAPPPFSGQVPWVFTVVEGTERIAGFDARALEYARAHRPEGAGSDWLDRPAFQIFWGAPALIIISGPVGDCCRAAQNLMLSAHARGLGTCWVGSPMPWLNTTEVRKELLLPADLAPVAVLCVGYPASVPQGQGRSLPAIIWTK